MSAPGRSIATGTPGTAAAVALASRKPPTNYRLNALIPLLSLCNLALYFNRVNMSIAVLDMFPEDADGNVSSAYASARALSLSSFYFGYPVFQVIGGAVSEKFGGDLVLKHAVFWWSLATVGMVPAFRWAMDGSGSEGSEGEGSSLGAALAVTVGFRTVVGLCEGVNYPSQTAIISRWIPIEERSRAWCWVESGENAGTVLAMLLCPLIASGKGSAIALGGGYTGIFLWSGILGVLWLAVFAVLGAGMPEQLAGAADKTSLAKRRGWISDAEVAYINARRGLSDDGAQGKASSVLLLGGAAANEGEEAREVQLQVQLQVQSVVPVAAAGKYSNTAAAGKRPLLDPEDTTTDVGSEPDSSATESVVSSSAGLPEALPSPPPFDPPEPASATPEPRPEVDTDTRNLDTTIFRKIFCGGIPWGRFLSSPAYLALCFVHFSVNWGCALMISTLPELYESRWGLKFKDLGYRPVLPYVILVLVGIVCGWAADKAIKSISERRARALVSGSSIRGRGCLAKVPATNIVRKTCVLFAAIATSGSFVILGFEQNIDVAEVWICLGIGLGACHLAGFIPNYHELSPLHYSSYLMGFGNSVAAFAGILANMSVPLLGTQQCVKNGKIAECTDFQNVFLCAAAVQASGGLAFVIFGDCRDQGWERKR